MFRRHYVSNLFRPCRHRLSARVAEIAAISSVAANGAKASNRVGSYVERRASCSCGALSIIAGGNPLKISVCHCAACQRRTGSSFGVGVFFASETTEETGLSSTFRRSGDSGKLIEFHFCPTCGSTVFWKREFRPGLTAVALGCFDEKRDLEPSQAVYDENRHAWVSIDIPQQKI
ncbi:GFA family protein [Rhizobium leguminosarum]|uniref:GFA family protein n=1 Tax=Rhizobium leguminosarum TaxID=384 RepID=UPI00391F177D